MKGWGKGMGEAAPEPKKSMWETLAVGPPVIHWLGCTADSTLVQAGLSAEGPAILFDKKQGLFHSSWHILNELVEDQDNTVQIEHDEEWKQLPELGEAFKKAGGD